MIAVNSVSMRYGSKVNLASEHAQYCVSACAERTEPHGHAITAGNRG